MKKKRLREKHIFLDRKYKLFVSHSVFKVNDRMIYVRNSFIPWISNIVFISILFVAFFPAFLIVNYQGHIDVMSRGRIDVTSGDVLIWRPGGVLKLRTGDVLIWRSRDVPGRLIPEISRTFSGRSLEDLQSTQTWMSQHFF